MQTPILNFFDHDSDITVYEIDHGKSYKVVEMKNCHVSASVYDSQFDALRYAYSVILPKVIYTNNKLK